MSRTKKGVSLINKNVDKFQSIIDGLGKGIEFCEQEIKQNDTKIQDFTKENVVIKESKILASTFKTNLSNMLKVPAKVSEDAEKAVDEGKKEDN